MRLGLLAELKASGWVPDSPVNLGQDLAAGKTALTFMQIDPVFMNVGFQLVAPSINRPYENARLKALHTEAHDGSSSATRKGIGDLV